jgi:hypothetical protein
MACILGQATYTSISQASNAVGTEVSGLYTVGLPLYEYIVIASILFQSNSGYANVYKARIVPNSLGTNFYDWRQKKINSTAGTVQSHSSLSGLAADDHPVYPTRAGRDGESITLTNGSLIVNGAAQKLVFDNQIARRRIALYTAADNDYQFFGLGIASGTLQFQVPAATNRFSFRQGASAVADVELMAIESPLATGSVKVFHVTPSTSPITGALLVAGGAGIGENLNVGGATTVAGNLTAQANVLMPSYSYIKMLGGNSQAYIQTSYSVFGDGMYLQYNQHSNGSTTVVDAPGGGTSGVQLGYGYAALRAGAVGVAATDCAAAFADRFQLYKPISGGGKTTYFTSLWSNMAATGYTLYLYKLADRVTVYVGNWSSTTDGTAGAVSALVLSNTVPVGWRPPDRMGIVVMYYIGGAFYNGFLEITAAGNVYFNSLPRPSFVNSSGITIYGFSFTYPTV